MKYLKLPLSILTISFTLLFSCKDKPETEAKATTTNTPTFTNPVFSGDYPDPSILVDDEDFYVVHSSFEYYPGLTIWHSKDLIEWSPITNALSTYVGSVYAPEITKHNNRYFIYFPANGTNYVVYADTIEGPWSEPIDLKISNIDPGHVVDEEGNRYLYFSNGGYAPLSKDGLSIIGESVHSYDGWPIPKDWVIECFCLEGPKLFKRGDYYYLVVAEGGTAGPATGHMVISARSKSPLGPWENSPYNPIIRAESPSEKWWSVGHATVFEASEENWWMLLHGYENGYHNMGRQSLLAPVEWTSDNWFKIPEDFSLDKPYKKPLEESNKSTYSLSDNFEGSNLKPQWKFFKNIDSTRYKVSNNSLEIKGLGNSIAESAPLLTIPTNHSYTVEVELEIEDHATGGLVLFYNQRAYSGVLANSTDILANLRGWQYTAETNVISNHVFLKLENKEHSVNMFYSVDGENWTKMETSLEVSAFHHNVLSEFLSLRIGLVSIGEGSVKFKNFNYTSL